MLEISLRQLETFAAAAEYGSFTRAAERLHLTQSTVSMHIQALEQTLGAQLILRGARKKFALTEEGRRVYAAARDILGRCEALQEMRESANRETMSIGTSTVPAQSLLPRLMAGFLKQHPGARYVLRRGDSEEVHALLEQGEARIGLLGATLDARRFVCHTVAQDRLVLITENNERFQKLQKEGATGVDLLAEPMIAREESSGTQRAVEEYLRRRNIAPEALRIVARMDNPESIKAGVSQGMGVSVISSLAIREEIAAGRLLSFDLTPDGAYRDICIAWRRDTALTPLEQRFVRYVRMETPRLV